MSNPSLCPRASVPALLPTALPAAMPSTASAVASRADASAPRWRLSPRAAFLLQASMAVSFLAGSAAPTPLYALYRAQWGFSATMLTVVFGIYAIAVLLSLLIAGRLSDHIGRRPVLLVAAAVQVLAMALFASADGLADLLLARVVQGLSAGAALAAVGAGLLDIDKARGALANSVAPMLGTALGAVGSALLVQYLPAPTQLVYLGLAVVFMLQGVGVAAMRETAAPRAGALASLLPRIALPVVARQPMLAVAPVVVAVWSLAGFYGSLGPTLVRSLSGSNGIVLGGLSLFVLAGSGVLTVLALRARSSATLLRVGAGALVLGMALVMAALPQQSMAGFLLGTAVAGIGFGAGFQGALRTLVGLIAAHERAGLLSVLLIVSYLAMGLPAVAAGYGLATHGDILVTAEIFGAAVLLLAVLALAGQRLAGRPVASPPFKG